MEQQINAFRTLSERMDQADSILVEARVTQLAGYVQMVLLNLSVKSADLRIVKHAIPGV